MDELLSEFLTETTESLDIVDVELVRFESNPQDADLLAKIFRLIHTIKGTCGFLGLPRLESVAHAAETLLGKFRDGELVATPEAVSLILDSLDHIKGLLHHLEAEQREPDGSDEDLIARLEEASKGEEIAADVQPAPEEDAGGIEVAEEPIAEEPSAPAVPSAVTVKDTVKGPAAQEPRAPETTIANQTIRVHVQVLENLMTMVSELVLTRNQLLEMVRHLDDSEFTVPLQRLSNVTVELQEQVMKTRMQPIGNAWQKLPRIVRDLSTELGKKIDLQMIGAETELDRQVLEMIKDPLVHMVRNAADHGLEPPEDRRAAGKPETGTVTLKAFHEGGHILIEIADDGRGLNTERIKEKAIAKGIVDAQTAEGLSDSQIQKFIFHPGFSTAQAVTSVSGRGVGMDVVRTNIEMIGGTVDLKSTMGKGTVLTVKIPLTLAIISALIVEAGGQKFAMPQLSIMELVRTSSGSEHKIERIKNAPVLRLRDRLLPLLFLSEELGLGTAAPQTETEVEAEAFVVVTRVGGQVFGIVVDGIHDTEEIVVKPVASALRDIPIFSGNTILGDGSVIMIIDPNGIAQRIMEDEPFTDDPLYGKPTLDFQDDRAMSLLIFRAAGPEPKAVPLSLVTRLEEIEADKIEVADGRHLVQYRDRLMPILPIDGSSSLKADGLQPLLVFTDDERAMGLAVDEIIDIVDDQLDVEIPSDRPGLLGTAVVKGGVTEVLDVSYYLTQAFEDWFERESYARPGMGRRRLLLVDDSAFFRHMIAPLLSAAGYAVTAVASVKEAWRFRDAGAQFDAIVSDLEMPDTDGYAFAEQVRDDPIWRDTPMIALSGHSVSVIHEDGKASGFTRHVTKTDRDSLVSVLNDVFENCEEAA